jgi:hypothetical protein
MSIHSSVQRKLHLLGVLLTLGLAEPAHATDLECPEGGKNAITISPLEERVFVTGGNTEVIGMMDSLIVNLKAKNPAISYDDLTNAAISVYCPIIANSPALNSQQKVDRIWALDGLLRERLEPSFRSR